MTLRLHQLMYLLSYEPAKNRMDINSAAVRGPLLRAAAVADLCIAGLLIDRDGRAARTGEPDRDHLDPFAREVLETVEPGRPRRWFSVVDHRWHHAEGTVRDQLAAQGTIAVERTRMLWLFPSTRVTVADLEPVRSARDRVRAPVMGGADPSAVPVKEAVLAAIAMDGHVATVFWRRELRANKAAVDALTDRVDHELPGLRKALAWSIAARRTATSA